MESIIELSSSQFSGFALMLGGYDFAFILVAVVMYLITSRFSYLGQKAVYNVQRINPEIEIIKKEFDGHPKKLNRELLALYGREGINPYGFLATTVPFFALILSLLALWQIINNIPNSIESAVLPWINNLAIADAFYILPALLGVVYFIQWWLNMRFNPPRNNAAKKFIMGTIPIAATVACGALPAGIAMYWITYAALTTGQQYIVFQHIFGT